MSNPLSNAKRELMALEKAHPPNALKRPARPDIMPFEQAGPPEIIARQRELRSLIKQLERSAGFRHKTSSIAHRGR